MRNQSAYQLPSKFSMPTLNPDILPRKMVIGLILMMALFAFEIFNYDTTRYALSSLLGDVRFLSIQWAAILAVAFCSIDFAGLVRLFTPEKGMDEPKEVWYLMGAWLLGATMNAVMTWWAVSLTLLNHEFGNEVLSREQLLTYVPIFVAVLVWLTRILFIGAFSVAGEHLFDFSHKPSQPNPTAVHQTGSNESNGRSLPQPQAQPQPATVPAPATRPVMATAPRRAVPKPRPAQPATKPIPEPEMPPFEPINPADKQPTPVVSRGVPKSTPKPPVRKNSRVRQRPPRPTTPQQPHTNGVQARPR